MNTQDDTRSSMVRGLKDWNDDKHWSAFVGLYSKLIFSVARQAGLNEEEAEDVVQETTLTVAKKMQEFEYDRERCSFKGWLMRCTQLRIVDQLRKRQANTRPDLTRQDNGDRTGTLNSIPDSSPLPLETIWENEWKKSIVEVALERLKDRLKPEHIQLFYLTMVQNLGVRKVAAMLDVTSAHVYLVRHRVAKLVKQEIESMSD